MRRLGPLTYLVRVGRQLRYVHIDHLLQTEHLNSEEAFNEVVPEESPVPMVVPVPVPSTPPPLPSTSVCILRIQTFQKPLEGFSIFNTN